VRHNGASVVKPYIGEEALVASQESTGNKWSGKAQWTRRFAVPARERQ